MTEFFDKKIEFLKGVGPQKAQVLNKELGIFTFGDLLEHYPFRHEDRTKIYRIIDVVSEETNVQIVGQITGFKTIGEGRKKRLVANFTDGHSHAELTWFRGVNYILKYLKTNTDYLVYGKPSFFKGKINIVHPEMEPYTPSHDKGLSMQPVYHTTELMKRKFLDSKGLAKIIRTLLQETYAHITETLSEEIIQFNGFISKRDAVANMHFPKEQRMQLQAQRRLKFEELFFVQLKILSQKVTQKEEFPGLVFQNIPLVTEFYQNHLPFDLTGAQKRVIKEVRQDFRTGKQMNRLLQGDVGSGKTIVSFICMLMAIDNGYQACLMAPTEILAEQHYKGLKEFADKLNMKIELLTGSTKKAKRTEIHQALEDGSLNIIIGTHALLEDKVRFHCLGFCVIDEQHRFGVAQRAKLWSKNKNIRPHILVMTATPIPRTLAMTLYGDLDVSVIDELPAGRKPIQTVHRYDNSRLRVFGFMREQIELGRQIYVVYPLIEESETLDLKDLTDGYESICRAFPEYHISIVHGKMKPDAKEYEMQRFVKNETQIMVATTVIEVGVNVPNASVMVIENAERFGLAQLHQLRGRVGRGAEQSYCILMTSVKLSKDSRTRIETMVKTNNGFEIADVDLKLRGPGDLAGTRQSGVLDLKIADLGRDGDILKHARETAARLLENPQILNKPINYPIRRQLEIQNSKKTVNWSRIS